MIRVLLQCEQCGARLTTISSQNTLIKARVKMDVSATAAPSRRPATGTKNIVYWWADERVSAHP